MFVQVRRACAVLLLAVGAGVTSNACVPNDSSLFIRSCLVTPLDSCKIDVSLSAPFLSKGALDAAFASEYNCPLMMENQLVVRGDTNKLRTETSRISVYAADVTLLNGEGKIITRADGSSAQFTTTISGFVDPGTGATPGFGATFVTLIDAATAGDLGEAARTTCLLQEVEARVIVHGRTLGGTELTSNEFAFPIQVGYGVLCVDPPGVSCKSATDKPPDNCRLGLDSEVDCRYLGTSCLDPANGFDEFCD